MLTCLETLRPALHIGGAFIIFQCTRQKKLQAKLRDFGEALRTSGDRFIVLLGYFRPVGGGGGGDATL